MFDPGAITVVPGTQYQVAYIPAQPDWFVIYKAVTGENEGTVERSRIIGWQIVTEDGIPGPASLATPITVHEGDWLGKTDSQEGLADWQWETAHLPGGRRHQWEIDAATAKSSNRPPGVVSNLTIFKP